MACKDSVIWPEIFADTLIQVSLGRLSTGTFAAMSRAECATYSRGIARIIGRDL